MFPSLSNFKKHGWETCNVFLICPPSVNMARKQCFLVCPPSVNMARKQCFLVCLPSVNMARKQCFLVCPPAENMETMFPGLFNFKKHG